MSRLRLLVVDDCRSSRERIVNVIDRMPDAEVVGIATDGAEALRLSRERSPDAVTLDLEMPEMGGFSFLRVLMGTRPLPVIVVSGNDQRQNVIRALELGALDFIAKTELSGAMFETSLAAKLQLVREARVWTPPHRGPTLPHQGPRFFGSSEQQPLECVVAIAASTGGPSALAKLLPKLEPDHHAFLIVQHMPPNFTTAFAERLDRYSSLQVAEAADGNLVTVGRVLVCPGDCSMEVERLRTGQLRIRLVAPTPSDRYVPNATRLLASVGRAVGRNAVGVVLTGMGDDGAEGARVIAAHGGQVLVESSETAIVDSMPRAAAKLVPDAVRVPLTILAERLLAMTARQRRVG